MRMAKNVREKATTSMLNNPTPIFCQFPERGGEKGERGKGKGEREKGGGGRRGIMTLV